MASPSDEGGQSAVTMSLEDIEAKIASLILIKNQKIAEAEVPKKEKKEKKKGKASKVDVKVPKVSSFRGSHF
jgi:hypothetical protein